MASMTSADFEMFQKFLAFQAMQAGPTDATVAVAADIAAPAPAPTPAPAPATRDVVVTIATAGGYGITATDGTLYSVGRAHREARGKIFAPYAAGSTVVITLVGKHAAACWSVTEAAPATAPELTTTPVAAPQVTAPAPVAAPVAAPQVTAPAPVAAPVAAPQVTAPAPDLKACQYCGRTPRKAGSDCHGNQGTEWLICSTRQYANAGHAPFDPEDAASVLAWAQWFGAQPRRVWASNKAGFIWLPTAPEAVTAPVCETCDRLRAIDASMTCSACQKGVATAAPSPSVPPQAPVTATEASAPRTGRWNVRCALPECNKIARRATGLCGKHSTPDPTPEPSAHQEIVATDAPTVHLSTADQAPVYQDITTVTGRFEGVLDRFKTEAQTLKKTPQNPQGWPIIRLRTAELVTKAGTGRWVPCEPTVYAKLVKHFGHLSSLREDSVIDVPLVVTLKDGALIGAKRQKDVNGKPVTIAADTAGLKSSGVGQPMVPAKARRDDTPKDRARAAKRAAARVTTSGTGAMTLAGGGVVSPMCTGCSRRLSMVGHSAQVGMCRSCFDAR